MNDQHYSNITNHDYNNNNNSINIFDNDFKNTMEIIIAEYIGSIPKNYFIEHQQLTSYTFYPPLSFRQIHKLAIDNVTTNEVQKQIIEKVYKQLEFIFPNKTINWNTVMQSTARKFIANAVEQAIEIIREKLLANIDNEKQISNVIVQRFVLINNQLKFI